MQEPIVQIVTFNAHLTLSPHCDDLTIIYVQGTHTPEAQSKAPTVPDSKYNK